MPSIYSLQIFDAVARRLSFTRAAEDLSITQGAVSYQIRHLEEDIGTALFDRGGRGITLTASGEALRPTLARALDDIRSVVEKVAKDAGSGLTISLTTYFAARWLLPRLAGFMRNHPHVEVRLMHGPGGNPTSAEDVDVAVRWGRGNWSGQEAELIFGSKLTPVCSPDLLKNHGSVLPLAIYLGKILHDDEMRTPWAEWLALTGFVDPETLEGPVIPDPNVRMQAAIDGHGFALADALVANDISEGRLVAPFDINLDGYGYYLMMGRRSSSKAVGDFREWLLGEGVNYLRGQAPTSIESSKAL